MQQKSSVVIEEGFFHRNTARGNGGALYGLVRICIQLISLQQICLKHYKKIEVFFCCHEKLPKYVKMELIMNAFGQRGSHLIISVSLTRVPNFCRMFEILQYASIERLV